jgi:broad specificity phosphatase PhoE
MKGKAAAGELHVFVSAMQRCMQTADPLITALGLTASIEPRLCEVPATLLASRGRVCHQVPISI